MRFATFAFPFSRPLNGFEHLVMLRLLNAFFDKPFVVASAFAVFVLARGLRHFMALGARHRVPAFRFGGRFKLGLLGVISSLPVNSRWPAPNRMQTPYGWSAR